MAKWLIACKEISGSVYVTRLPQSQAGPFPGVPAPWVFVGPGSNPSVQEYSGNLFILIFEYLSHLVVRVFDITSWPPTQVNPLSISGGPNPPSAFLFGVATGGTAKIPNDEYIFRVPTSSLSAGQVRNQYDPPYLQQVLIFHDPVGHTFSVELKPDPTWKTNIPNTTNFFRLYRAPLGSNSFTRIMDWSTTLDFTDTMPDSSPFRFQYAASIGAYFNPAQPDDPAQHEESFMGPILGFDSTVGPLGFLLIPADTYDLIAGSIAATRVPSADGYGIFTPTQRFFISVFSDSLDFPGIGASRQEVPTSSTSSMGAREGFISFPQSTPGLFTDAMRSGNSPSHAYSTGGNGAVQITAT